MTFSTACSHAIATGVAVTAAEPSELWGLLKESFAGGKELAKAKMDSGVGALIKAVINDFGTAEGRSISHDGLKAKLKNSKPAEIRDKCVETLRQAAATVDTTAPGDAAAFENWLRQTSLHAAQQNPQACRHDETWMRVAKSSGCCTSITSPN